MHFKLYLFLLLNFSVMSVLTYTVPTPLIEFLYLEGKGRRMRTSIPDEDGIENVCFRIHNPSSIDNFSTQVFNATDGEWVFDLDITNVFILPGNKLYYWVIVQHKGEEHMNMGSIEAPPAALNPEYIEALEWGLKHTYGQIIDRTKKYGLFADPKCEPSKTTVNQTLVCKGQLIFEDNFDSLNLTTWKHEVRIPLYADDAEFVSYQKRDENCYVSDGQLHIIPTLLSNASGFNESIIRTGRLDFRKECTGIVDINEECLREAHSSQILPPVVSARIRTKNFFSFRYGKIEVRAKMPKGDWLFPLILLEPTENYYGSTGYASGQLRVAYIRGNEILNDRDDNEISGFRIAGGMVLSTREALRDVWLRGSVRRSHLGDDFHNYTLTWTDELISLEIDGNEYATIRSGFAELCTTQKLDHAKLWDTANSAMAPFDREFFLTLGLAAGGHSDFPDGARNGLELREKPWMNAHPKAELQFWKDRENWLKTGWTKCWTSCGLH